MMKEDEGERQHAEEARMQARYQIMQKLHDNLLRLQRSKLATIKKKVRQHIEDNHLLNVKTEGIRQQVEEGGRMYDMRQRTEDAPGSRRKAWKSVATNRRLADIAKSQVSTSCSNVHKSIQG